MHKIYKLDSYLGGTISSSEAKVESIKTNNLPLASIIDCQNQINKESFSGAYSGKIKVLEGVYEFDYDQLLYVKIK